MGAVLQFTTVVEYRCCCCKCGTPIFMTDAHYAQKLKDKTDFYCVAGHNQAFIGETELDRAKRSLEFEKTRRESAERDRDTARKAEAIVRGKLKAQSERVANGVCPCCKRSFQNLMRHMSTKHPDFKKSEVT